MDLLTPLYAGLSLLNIVVLLVEIFAFVDSAIRPAAAYPAADKQTKRFWLVILGLAVAWTLLVSSSAIGFINLIGLIAAIVYIVDARPALKAVGRGGGRDSGPYGPW